MYTLFDLVVGHIYSVIVMALDCRDVARNFLVINAVLLTQTGNNRLQLGEMAMINGREQMMFNLVVQSPTENETEIGRAHV